MAGLPPPTMLAPFTVLGKQLKIKPGKASIDNLVFWLHYRATCVLLILCTILVCSREYIGEHIRCLVDKGIPEKVINTFCFFTSTFTVARHYNESAIESGYIPHPGVGPMRDTDETTHHAYYQWVPFVLFGQAIAFYLPHTLWKKLEGGKIQALVNGLHFAAMSYAEEDIAANGIVVPSRHAVKEKISTIKTNFLTRLHSSRNWSMNLIFCEFLNFVNIIFQIYITNVFLGGQFIGLGTKINHVDWDGAMDPLDVIFPKVTKCLFHKYGPSGSIQSHDALCVMALNVINEKIYTILWFWFLMLFIVSSLGLIWRLMTVLFHSRSARFSEMVFSSASPTRLDLKNVISVTHHGNFPDWLFLYYLAKNMDGFIFKNLFINLAEEMDRHESAGSQPGSPPYYNGGGSVTDEKVPIMDQPIDYPDKKADEPVDILKFYDEETPRRVSTASDQDIRKEPLREKDE